MKHGIMQNIHQIIVNCRNIFIVVFIALECNIIRRKKINKRLYFMG